MSSVITYLLVAVIACSEAGENYYYGGSSYPIAAYNGYNPVESIYRYDGAHGYNYYGEGDYDNDYYPYAYQKRVGLPSEYVEPLPAITKSISSSSLYQTHPSSYGYHGYPGNGYAGNYEYVPKYGSVNGNTYYKK